MILKVAEIGLNHMGSAKYLLKYQKFLSKKRINAITIQVPKDEFFKGKFKKFYLNDQQIINFIKCAKKRWNLVGVATSSYDKIDMFSKLHVDFFKVTSGMIKDIKLIKKMIKSNAKRIYLSTGFSSYADIKKVLSKTRKKKLA